jgi:phage gpG-like protein
MPTIKVKIEGIERLRMAMKDPRLVKGPVQKFLSKSALTIEGKAKQLAPVDTGRLRASIRTDLAPLRAVVGTNVEYAPYVEHGTGGRKGARFMARGVQASMRAIQGFLRDAAREIERRWGRG